MTTRVLVTGGGTGGHVFPAIAIAQALSARRPDVDVQFVGSSAGMEMHLVPKYGIKTHGVTVAGLYRQFTLNNIVRNLQLPFKVLRGYLQARALVRNLAPVLVVGTGGYASLPTLYAATNAGVPIVLTEQNAFPGLVNRRMAGKAAKIILGNGDAVQHFGANAGKCVVTGNPVRANLSAIDKVEARQKLGIAVDKKLLLVVGGSLGARTLNRAIAAGLSAFADANIELLWQCGKLYHAQYMDVAAAYSNVRLQPFLDDMAAAYAAADLVVSRAGAITIAELAAVGKPAILVPSPNVADDHQTHNARSVVSVGAAVLITDTEADTKLVQEAIRLLAHTEALRALQLAASTLPKQDSANRIVVELIPLLPAA